MQRALKPLHPGGLLKEQIEHLNLTQKIAADELGITRQHLSRILNGKAPLTTSLAVRLSKMLGSSARIWVNLQADYDIWHERAANAKEINQINCYV